MMLRVYILQNLYSLFDKAAVAEVIGSRAFSDFCGVASDNQVLGGDTLGRFCKRIRYNINRRSIQSTNKSAHSKGQIK